MVRSAFDITQLAVAERLELIDGLWASLPTQHAALAPVSPEDVAVIEARRADHQRDPSSAVPWETVRVGLPADQASDEEAATDQYPERGV